MKLLILILSITGIYTWLSHCGSKLNLSHKTTFVPKQNLYKIQMINSETNVIRNVNFAENEAKHLICSTFVSRILHEP